MGRGKGWVSLLHHYVNHIHEKGEKVRIIFLKYIYISKALKITTTTTTTTTTKYK